MGVTSVEQHFWRRGRYVSDGGLETDLIFNHGVDLPEFAAFPLVGTASGRALLRAYYLGYAEVARAAGVGLTMESPTWRANPDWGARLGYDASALEDANRAAVDLLVDLRAALGGPGELADVRVVGAVGPRGDGYSPDERTDAAEAADYHAPQVAALAGAGADVVAAYTLTGVAEGAGVTRAARAAGVPVLVGFTVETDGRLPDGTTLRDAVEHLDDTDPPDGYVVNCAHPTHMAHGVDGGAWTGRIVQVNPNASTLSHAELDEAADLDTGDVDLLASSFQALAASLPSLAITGGCCGTDVRHVAALWGVPPPGVPDA